MKIAVLALVLLCACGPTPPNEPVTQLAHDGSDTIVVNGRHPTQLELRALDAAGLPVPGAAVQYVRVGGDSIPLDSSGTVTCTPSGAVEVLATAGQARQHLTILCRVVEYVRVAGPFQFVLGDALLSRPRSVQVDAYDLSAKRIAPIAYSIGVMDTSIAVVHGRVLFPRRRGITALGARSGDRDIGAGVHVYQRVSALDALDTLLRVPPDERLFAVPLLLQPGEMRRQRLPPGDWMLTMVPESDTSKNRIRLRIEGSRCTDHFLNTPRRWGCAAGTGAAVVLYREQGSPRATDSTSYLLVRWLFS